MSERQFDLTVWLYDVVVRDLFNGPYVAEDDPFDFLYNCTVSSSRSHWLYGRKITRDFQKSISN